MLLNTRSMGIANEVSDYLNGLSPRDQAKLRTLREQIMNAVPNLEERLSRGVPFFITGEREPLGFTHPKIICPSL